ncbi:MAG: DUF4412 domain-containing protein [Chitinophagales bacterium]|nr:DUF4412 domain-containing protein [Chitinophagales bacterium]
MNTTNSLSLQKLISFVILLVISQNLTTAQVWKNAVNKISQKNQTQTNEKVDKKNNDSLDKDFDENEIDEQAILKSMGISFDTKTKDEYIFDLGVTYKTAMGKQSSQEITMWVGKDSYIGMGNAIAKNVIIFDFDNNSTVIFQENEKTYMGIKLNINETANSQATEEKPYKIEKIGTETILGYSCDKYKVTTDENESIISISKDLQYNYMDFAKKLNSTDKSNKANFPSINGIPNGMMLKTVTTDLKTKQTMTMEATQVIQRPTIFKTSDYKKMGM